MPILYTLRLILVRVFPLWAFSVITYVHFMFRHRATWKWANQRTEFANPAIWLVVSNICTRQIFYCCLKKLICERDIFDKCSAYLGAFFRHSRRDFLRHSTVGLFDFRMAGFKEKRVKSSAVKSEGLKLSCFNCCCLFKNNLSFY